MVNVDMLKGMKVVTDDAWVVGEVAGTETDTEKWEVTHLRINLTKDSAKELGFKKPLLGDVVICVPVNFIKAHGDVINLHAPFSDLASLEECK